MVSLTHYCIVVRLFYIVHQYIKYLRAANSGCLRGRNIKIKLNKDTYIHRDLLSSIFP